MESGKSRSGVAEKNLGANGTLRTSSPPTTMFAAARSLRLAASRSGNYAVSIVPTRLARNNVSDVRAGPPAVDDRQEHELQGQR